jgi:hypothetical protein
LVFSAALLSLGFLPLASPPPLASPAVAMNSPWWEDYDVKERFRCSDQATIVVERNESQASVFTGRYRSTLFRETGEASGLRYRNEIMRLILRGDELTLEQLPLRLTCIRTEEV